MYALMEEITPIPEFSGLTRTLKSYIGLEYPGAKISLQYSTRMDLRLAPGGVILGVFWEGWVVNGDGKSVHVAIDLNPSVYTLDDLLSLVPGSITLSPIDQKGEGWGLLCTRVSSQDGGPLTVQNTGDMVQVLGGMSMLARVRENVLERVYTWKDPRVHGRIFRLAEVGVEGLSYLAPEDELMRHPEQAKNFALRVIAFKENVLKGSATQRGLEDAVIWAQDLLRRTLPGPHSP